MQHQSVVKAFRKKTPDRWKNGEDQQIWEKGKEFLVPLEGFSHGAVVWVEVEGRDTRLQARICRRTNSLVFAEDLKKSKKSHGRKYSWTEIYKAIRRIYEGGRKPEDVSWSDAVKAAEKALDDERLPSLMSQRACAPCPSSPKPLAVCSTFVKSAGVSQGEVSEGKPLERLMSLRACAPAI